MGFASEMIRDSLNIYKSAVQGVKDTALKETLRTLMREEEKNHTSMEQIRRENVTEMILEPIVGLQKENYRLDLKLSGNEKDADLIKLVLMIEEREQKFFDDSSVKLPLPEVARIFRKIAQKKRQNLAKLKALGLSQFLSVSS
jgi:hypothetical protein